MIVRREAKVCWPRGENKRKGSQMMPASQYTRHGARSIKIVGEEASVWATLNRARCHVRQDNLQQRRFQRIPTPLERYVQWCGQRSTSFIYIILRLLYLFVPWRAWKCVAKTSFTRLTWQKHRFGVMGWWTFVMFYIWLALVGFVIRYWFVLLPRRIGPWIWLWIWIWKWPSVICTVTF